jgi:hypothetical protein
LLLSILIAYRLRRFQFRLLPILFPLIFSAGILLLPDWSYGQGCCSGGSGSPIAGGTSQGVLADRQAEVSASFQYLNSNRFQTGSEKARNFLDNYNSEYLYSRFAYGAAKNLTVSVESGYYFNKSQTGLNNSSKVSNSGIGDLILFPRYSVYNRNTEKTRNEITLGMGLKIPMGKYLDSSVIYTDPNTGKNYFTPMPPAVLATTGSQDFIFYGFGYRGYPSKKFRLFTSLLYVRKGWNPLGQKFGDYASIGLFAGKTYRNKYGITLQLKGEWVDVMRYDKAIDMLAKYNLDVNSTGGRKIMFVPQLNYNYKTFSVYLLSEVPLYQYVNGTAIASQYLFTLGFSYRFMMVQSLGE